MDIFRVKGTLPWYRPFSDSTAIYACKSILIGGKTSQCRWLDAVLDYLPILEADKINPVYTMNACGGMEVHLHI